MKKLLIYLILSILVSSSTALASSHQNELENQIEQVRRERESLVLEQKRLEAELEIVNKESQTLGSAVKSLDTTRKKLVADINVTQSKITSTNLVIKSLENKMGEKEEQILAHRKAIAQALQTLSQYDSRSLVLDLLSSAKFSDVWRDRSELESLNLKMEEEINSLRETKKVLDQEKKQKEKAKAEQLSLKGQLSGQKSVVEENQKAKEKLLAETKSKESEYQKKIAENIARQKQSEQDMANLEEQLRITLDPSLYPEVKHGILSWPVDNVYITGKFGKSDCNIYPLPDCFHNGLDFRASMGTPIRAMAHGVVSGSDNTDRQKGCYSYGRWVLLKYDNGLSSVYSHLSATIVKNGQRVNAGEIVAYSGGAPGVYGSGYSTAQHLHIGLFPSQGVEIKLFTTSIGCKRVYVPLAKGREAYLDPLDYLPTL